MEKIKRIDIKEFREMGLLQEINRQFLHPLGLALEVIIDEETEIESLGGIWDYREDDEGMTFGDGMINPEKVKNIKEFTKRQHKKRKETIGFIIQEK